MAENPFAILRNYPGFFSSLFADLESAKSSIRAQMYCVDEGATAEKFRKILSEKAQAGLTVEIMYDSVGSILTSSSYFDEMAKAGIKVKEYHPVNPRRVREGTYSIKKLFRRNHRKLIIIDSNVYYLGGMNIGDRFHDWEDLMVRGVGGPVSELEKSFDRVWHKTPRWPSLQRYHLKNDSPIMVCDCRPQLNNYPIKRLYISAIKKAKKRIWIALAYFVPRRNIMKALSQAVNRGVDVRVVVPDVSDIKLVDLASWPVIRRLVKKGVRVFRFENRMMHSKVAIIDDDWMTLGTANLDSMSFYWNLELNLVVRDKQIVKTVAGYFEDYERESREVMQGDAEARPLALRLLGRALYYYSWIL